MKDIENLKLKAYESDKATAKAILHYLGWGDSSEARKNFESIYAKELEITLE